MKKYLIIPILMIVMGAVPGMAGAATTQSVDLPKGSFVIAHRGGYHGGYHRGYRGYHRGYRGYGYHRSYYRPYCHYGHRNYWHCHYRY